MEIQWTKLVTIALVTVGATVVALQSGDATQAYVVYAAALGYVFGNGHSLVEKSKA